MNKVGTPSDQRKGSSQRKKSGRVCFPRLKIRKIVKVARHSAGNANEMSKAYEHAAGDIMPESAMMDKSKDNGSGIRSIGIQVSLPPVEAEGLVMLAEVASKCKKI